MKSRIIEVLRFFKSAVNVSKNHSVRIGKEESSYIYRTRSKIKSPEKIAHCFFSIDNHIANISLYALNRPKLSFGY